MGAASGRPRPGVPELHLVSVGDWLDLSKAVCLQLLCKIALTWCVPGPLWGRLAPGLSAYIRSLLWGLPVKGRSAPKQNKDTSSTTNVTGKFLHLYHSFI